MQNPLPAQDTLSNSGSVASAGAAAGLTVHDDPSHCSARTWIAGGACGSSCGPAAPPACIPRTPGPKGVPAEPELCCGDSALGRTKAPLSGEMAPTAMQCVGAVQLTALRALLAEPATAGREEGDHADPSHCSPSAWLNPVEVFVA